MISELIENIKNHIETAITGGRLSMVKRVYYGPAQSISSIEYPAIFFNIIDVGDSIINSAFPTLTIKVGLYLCTAILANKEDTAINAQSLFWSYESKEPKDRGLFPWLLEESQKPWFVDSRRRVWKMTLDGPPRIYSDNVGPNVRGAVYVELALKTKIDKIN